MNVLNRLFLISAILLISTKGYAEETMQTFMRLRALQESTRIAEFGRQDKDTKMELFFIANGRHPPYSGFDTAIAQEGMPFFLILRNEIDKKGGTPEVLDFLSIASLMKRSGLLTIQDIEKLKLNDICSKAPQSNYCKVQLNKILVGQ